MMSLYDSDGNALNSLLENSINTKMINIVINKTIVKQLVLHINDTFKMTTNGNIMEFKNNPNDKYKIFDVKDIIFDELDKNVVDKVNNVTLNKQNNNFNQVPNLQSNTYVN